MDNTNSLKSEVLEIRADTYTIILSKARDVVQQFKLYPSIVPQNGQGITLYNSPLRSGVMENFISCLQKELTAYGYDIPLFCRESAEGYSIDVAGFLKIFD